MSKVNIIGFEDWKVYDGFAEGSGRGEKIWLQSDKGDIGLFKFPKFDSSTSDITTEYISEHLAYRIGQIVGVDTARIDIGIRNQRLGCMSYLLNKPDEAIVEGAIFISGKHPDYDTERMLETESGRYYCLEHIFEIDDGSEFRSSVIRMMLFDFLIGNSDRHQNNWAILVRYDENNKSILKGRFCPLYDNGSSLCSFYSTKQSIEILGNDKRRFNAVVDTKSKSLIRINGFDSRTPTHVEVVRYLLKNYPYAIIIADSFINSLTFDVIDNITGSYSDIVDSAKLELINLFLKRKIEILKELRNEVK